MFIEIPKRKVGKLKFQRGKSKTRRENSLDVSPISICGEKPKENSEKF